MNSLVQTNNKENWMAIKEQAEAVKRAGLLPQAMTAEQAAIIVLKGQELGIGTMRSLEGLYVVNGKIGMSAALVMGLIRERCPQAKITVKKKDNKGCIIEAQRPGQEVESFQFLESDAKAAGLLKPNSPWEKYGPNMYWSRAVTNMGRQLFSDILGAPYTPEELGGHPEKEELETKEIPSISGQIDHVGHSEDKQSILHRDNGPSQLSQNKKEEVTQGASVSSLNDRLNTPSLQPQASSMAVTAPPKSAKQSQPVLVEQIKEALNKDTGEVPLFDADEPLPDQSLDLTHWDRIASSGPNSGKTLRKIFEEVGKEGFLKMYQVSTQKIAKMGEEGKTVPKNTMETYKDLESCCKELGL